jgi:hypothetical protein
MASRILSDTWWTPQESGWSLVLEHGAERSHAMLHSYDADGKAQWYVAPLETTALTAEGLPLLAGTLYATEGPSQPGPWDPSQVQVTPIGQLVIEPTSVHELAVHTTFDGTVRSVALQRFTIESSPLPGAYASTAVLRVTAPGHPVQMQVQQQQVVVDIVDGSFWMVAAQDGGDCNYMGDIEQAGRITEVHGSYACGNGESGPFELTELVETPHGFSGRLHRVRGDRVSDGTVGWLRLQ